MRPAPPEQMPKEQKFYKTWNETDCVLKQATSITNPTFVFKPIVNPDGSLNYVSNYIYVPQLGRGYWVMDWSYGLQTWEARCHVDVLGSFELPKEPQYVGRCAAEYNQYISDGFYPTTNDIDTQETVHAWPFARNISGGRFILGITGARAGALGSVTYYVMTQTQLYNLCQELLSSIGYMGIDVGEISEELQKALVNPMQYINSCMWVPWNPDGKGVHVTTVKCGWWDFNCDCYVLETPVAEEAHFTMDIPLHPDIQTRGNYFFYPPYSTYKMLFLPWGLIDIPFTLCKYKGPYTTPPVLEFRIWCDSITGEARLLAKSNIDKQILVNMNTQLGVPIQISQVIRNMNTAGLIGLGAQAILGGADSAVNKLDAVLPGSASGGRDMSSMLKPNAAEIAKNSSNPIGSALNGVLKAAAGLGTAVSSVGGTGSFLNISSENIHLYATFHKTTAEDNYNYGRPLCEKRDLRDMTGYVQIVNPHYVADSEKTPPTAAEMLEFEQMMGNGFYIESWLG